MINTTYKMFTPLLSRTPKSSITRTSQVLVPTQLRWNSSNNNNSNNNRYNQGRGGGNRSRRPNDASDGGNRNRRNNANQEEEKFVAPPMRQVGTVDRDLGKLSWMEAMYRSNLATRVDIAAEELNTKEREAQARIEKKEKFAKVLQKSEEEEESRTSVPIVVEELDQEMLAEVRMELFSFLASLPVELKELVQENPEMVIPSPNEDGNFVAKGTRKRSICYATLMAGTGNVQVNDLDIGSWFDNIDDIMHATEALRVADVEGAFDVKVDVYGGGKSGQAGAIRLAVARALVEFRPIYRQIFKPYKLLTRDPREVERKKPGQKKARKKFAWVKR